MTAILLSYGLTQGESEGLLSNSNEECGMLLEKIARVQSIRCLVVSLPIAA